MAQGKSLRLRLSGSQFSLLRWGYWDSGSSPQDHRSTNVGMNSFLEKTWLSTSPLPSEHPISVRSALRPSQLEKGESQESLGPVHRVVLGWRDQRQKAERLKVVLPQDFSAGSWGHWSSDPFPCGKLGASRDKRKVKEVPSHFEVTSPSLRGGGVRQGGKGTWLSYRWTDPQSRGLRSSWLHTYCTRAGA